MPRDKAMSLLLLLLAVCGAMSLWFVSAAILPGMKAEFQITPFRAAALSSAVQLGFVAGALVSAILGIADRYDPRRVLGLCAILAGLVNLALLATVPGSARLWPG